MPQFGFPRGRFLVIATGLAILMGGILLFIVGLIAAQQAAKFDTEILRVLLNSAKFKPRYDPMKWEPTEIRIRRDV